MLAIMLMGFLPCLGNMLFDIGGKSPTEYLAYFLLGYFFLAKEGIQERLDKYRYILLGVALLAAGLTLYFDNLLFEVVCWLCVLAILGWARHSFNVTGRFVTYLSKNSFGIYLFHQSWIVIIGYFVLRLTDNYWLQIPLILLGATALTFLTNEAARRVPPLRWAFRLKK
jgi:surface polysaccharide O-acyltransferase-like enzyme